MSELNKLVANEDDSDDDNDDFDYKPENEALSENSGSDSDLHEFGSEEKKKCHKKNKQKFVDNNGEEDKEVDKKLTEEEEKAKAEDIWAEFCKDMPIVSRNARNESNVNNIQSTDSLTSNIEKSGDNNEEKKTLITKTFDFAGESVTVVEESFVKSRTQAKTDGKPEEGINKSVKRSVGLEGILNKLKKPKISTLEKSSIDWRNFKKDEGIEEELSQHSRSKDTFIERQAFLQRTDLRQFEIEKEIRAKNRSQRQLSKN